MLPENVYFTSEKREYPPSKHTKIDIGTKRFPASRMRSPMSLLGMYNVATGAFEGAEDPGHLFQQKHHVMTILSVGPTANERTP